jgi:hypothetical protein
MGERLLVGSDVFLLIGGASALATGVWALSAGRRTLRRSAYGRSMLAIAPLQLAAGLVVIVYSLVSLASRL